MTRLQLLPEVELNADLCFPLTAGLKEIVETTVVVFFIPDSVPVRVSTPAGCSIGAAVDPDNPRFLEPGPKRTECFNP